MITDVMRRAGFKAPTGRTGPRVHDLRHSMVVNRILQWYRAGVNPQDKLHFLSTTWATGISTPRWSTSPSRRICCRKQANASVPSAPDASPWRRGHDEKQPVPLSVAGVLRSEEHTSELPPLMRHSYAVF